MLKNLNMYMINEKIYYLFNLIIYLVKLFVKEKNIIVSIFCIINYKNINNINIINNYFIFKK